MTRLLGTARRGRALTGASLVAVLLAAAGLLGLLTGGGSPEPDPSEPRLDRLPPTAFGHKPGERKGNRPVKSRVGPTSTTGDRASEEEPPARIRKQDAALRRELKHLRALEAERRRVASALRKAGVTYGGIVHGSGNLIWPVNGAVVSPFGQRWGRLHAGIDIAARAGTVVHAAESGRVAIAAPTGGYGNYVCVQHTARLTTCYAHLSELMTERGAAVEQGDPLGLVGCTGHCFGDHLHFETWVGGRPVDPRRYL